MLATLTWLRACFATLFAMSIAPLVPSVFAQSSQVEIEWRLFNEILIIGIIVGIVVFGLLFYAIIRYREKPVKSGATR
jgi:heme/copper-type cytochrome/quinol oxidase subunit 2